MVNDLRGAFAFLTVIPVGRFTWGRPGRIFSYFPLVGLVIGLALAGVTSLDGLPRDVRALFALVVWVVLTGGLHLDGWGDACDGLLATVDPPRRLEIMKDPRAGSWAVIGISLLLLSKWVLLQHVEPIVLLLPPVVGRWAMVLAVGGFRYGRESGTGSYFRDGFGRFQLLVATLSVLIVALAVSWPAGLVILAAPVVVAGVGRWSAQRLGGGLTGDVYGALCELTEVVCLGLLACL